jgi:membrane-associated protein
MEYILLIINFIAHLNQHLQEIIGYFGGWSYFILFLVIFAETGLVITPFLPGDSLLFAAGAICAIPNISINVHLLIIILFFAAATGDSFNYFIGHLLGEKLFKANAKVLNTKHLIKTHAFFERYGGKTIVIARFIPIVRTFAPFVAGAGKMTYKKFMFYNIVGAAIWVTSITYLGYFFGGFPIVKNNFGIVVLAIILISITPAIYEWLKFKLKKKK